MRIEVSEPGRSAHLRDYFSRLGARAVLDGDRVVEVDFPDDLLDEDEGVGSYLQRWTEANGVTATLVTAPAETAPATSTPPAQVAQVIELGPASGGPPKQRLGDLLVTKGLLTQDQLSAALVESRERGDLVGRVLLRRGYVFEEELARTLAEQWGLPFVSLYRIGVDARAARMVPPDTGLRFAAIPVRFVEGGAVQVAFADPSDPEALQAISGLVPQMTAAVSELSDIETAWRKLTQGSS